MTVNQTKKSKVLLSFFLCQIQKLKKKIKKTYSWHYLGKIPLADRSWTESETWTLLTNM